MADTAQYVNWHLEQACPFRQGPAVTQFVAAHDATWRLRYIDTAAAKNDVFDDIVVTSVSYFRGDKSPAGGFRISEAVAAAGSLVPARDVCARCPANAFDPPAERMAGCCGLLPFNPDDPALEKRLRSALHEPGLRRWFDTAFLPTTPLWYGLWATSPLTQDQLKLLPRVLPQRPPNGPDLDEDVLCFHRACALAMRHGLTVRVNLPPPGHTDLGWDTTFPHCPRCKKGTGEQWEKQYSTRRTTCRACGFEFVPAETASSEQSPPYDDKDSLERMMSPESYAALKQEWLRRHAADPPTFIDRLLTGKLEAADFATEAAARPSLAQRFWRWLRH
jgi:hypothetical protein